MSEFPAYPTVNDHPPNHHNLYLQIQWSVRSACSLLDEEVVDVIRLKVSGDKLENHLADMHLLTHENAPAGWAESIHLYLNTLLARVRNKQEALLEE